MVIRAKKDTWMQMGKKAFLKAREYFKTLILKIIYLYNDAFILKAAQLFILSLI